MVIFPAIDLRNGKCVRLEQGKAEKETVYDDDPIERAKMWESKGAKFLHIIDLDGAINGVGENRKIVGKIVDNVNIPVQLGGGIRSIEDIEDALMKGVSRVILGTSALKDEEFLKKALEIYKDKIAVSVDAKDGLVAIEGWTKVSDASADSLAKDLENIGVKTLIYTDISKDGMLQGPNFSEIKKLKNSLNIDVIAAGGVSSAKDVEKLKELNLYGAIIGKALYTGDIELEEVLR
jgi:phosphoribosylformimino-5-aminoimidazole carboxamide ribotide isomerase